MSPAAKARMAASFSSEGILPCSGSTRMSANRGLRGAARRPARRPSGCASGRARLDGLLGGVVPSSRPRRRSPGTRRTPAGPAPSSSASRSQTRPTHAGFSASGTTNVSMPARPVGQLVRMVETSRSPNTVIATVRGIGVAVSTSTCGDAPLAAAPRAARRRTGAARRRRRARGRRTGRGRRGARGCRRRCRACPEAARSAALRRSAAGSCPVRRVGMSSAASSGPSIRGDRAQVLRREHLGRREERRLAAGVGDRRASRAARRASCPSRPRPARAGSSASPPARSRAIWSPTVDLVGGERERQVRVEPLEQCTGLALGRRQARARTAAAAGARSAARTPREPQRLARLLHRSSKSGRWMRSSAVARVEQAVPQSRAPREAGRRVARGRRARSRSTS